MEAESGSKNRIEESVGKMNKDELSTNKPSSQSSQSISLVVPLYNEEATIGELTEKLNQYFLKLGITYEIILVESGSTDRSGEVCDELSKKYSTVKVIHEGARNGYGSGIRTGWSQAHYEIMTYVDSDSPCSLDYYAKALELLRNPKVDVVLGYRVGGRENFTRWFFSKGYNWLTKFVFGLWGMRDVNFTFKLFRKEMYDKVSLQSKGWFIDVELLAELKKQKARWVQLPVNYTPRTKGSSTVKINAKLLRGFLKEIYDYKFHR